jgi:hypothetical protein
VHNHAVTALRRYGSKKDKAAVTFTYQAARRLPESGSLAQTKVEEAVLGE